MAHQFNIGFLYALRKNTKDLFGQNAWKHIQHWINEPISVHPDWFHFFEPIEGDTVYCRMKRIRGVVRKPSSPHKPLSVLWEDATITDLYIGLLIMRRNNRSFIMPDKLYPNVYNWRSLPVLVQEFHRFCQYINKIALAKRLINFYRPYWVSTFCYGKTYWSNELLDKCWVWVLSDGAASCCTRDRIAITQHY